MKKLNSMLVLVMITLFAGCTAPGSDDMAKQEPQEVQTQEINVFAAASMQETLEKIVEDYSGLHSEVAICLNLDSSGTLKTQIEEGAPCDLFISAAQKQMDQLDVTASVQANPDRLDYIDPDSRVNLLENKVVLIVPDGNPKKVTAFSEIVEKAELIAIGNEDVPVGQYSKSELVLPVIVQVSVSDLRVAHNPDMPLLLAFQGLFISLLGEKGAAAFPFPANRGISGQGIKNNHVPGVLREPV